MSGGGMTFNLQLHEFDLAAALEGHGGGNEDDQVSRRRLLSNVSELVSCETLFGVNLHSFATTSHSLFCSYLHRLRVCGPIAPDVDQSSSPVQRRRL